MSRDSTGTHKTLVVIAAHNEAESIAQVVRSIPRHLEGISLVDVVVVDDGSRDSTREQASEAGALVIRHPINRGQGAALKTGFDYAIMKGYDAVVTFDADGQHRSSEIVRLLSALFDENYDIVLGSRFLGNAVNMPASRKLVLKIGVIFTRILSRVRVTDTHNGFRAVRTDALKKMRLWQDRMEHASEIIDQIHKQQLRYCEVPVTIEYSEYSMRKGQRNTNALRIAMKMIADKLLH